MRDGLVKDKSPSRRRRAICQNARRSVKPDDYIALRDLGVRNCSLEIIITLMQRDLGFRTKFLAQQRQQLEAGKRSYLIAWNMIDHAISQPARRSSHIPAQRALDQ